MGFFADSQIFLVSRYSKRLLSTLIDPPIIFYFTLITLLVFLVNPGSFLRTWNDGNGALIALPFLVVLELRMKGLQRLKNGKKSLLIYLMVFVSSAFVYAVEYDFSRKLAEFAIRIGIDPAVAYYSWVQAVIFAVIALAVSSISALIDRKIVLPSLYTFALMLFLMLDSLFPFNEIGILQVSVSPVLQLTAFLINLTGLGQAIAYGNLLRLANSTGSTTLAVYWPSAGVEGMIIAILMVLAFSIKLDVPNIRKLVYVFSGLLLAYIANCIRLVALSLYVLQDVSDLNSFERFHSVIGDLVFFPFLALFLLYIYRREMRKSMTFVA